MRDLSHVVLFLAYSLLSLLLDQLVELSVLEAEVSNTTFFGSILQIPDNPLIVLHCQYRSVKVLEFGPFPRGRCSLIDGGRVPSRLRAA